MTDRSPKTETGDSILIVDDTPDNLQLLSYLLSKEGYTVRVMASGSSALESVRAEPPDLILLDIMMPGMSGYEVCQQLKADQCTREIPVIFISALNVIQDRVKAFDMGGVDYITKPFHSKDVLARVRIHLDLLRTRRQLEQKNVRLEREVTERRRAEKEASQYADRLQILRDMDQSILAAESPSAIALAAIGRLRRLIPCQRALAIALSGSDGIETLASESDGELREIGTGVYREMLKNGALGKGLIQGSNNLEVNQQSAALSSLYAAGARSYVAVPLFIDDELIGSLNLEAVRPDVFTADHIAIASETAIMLAVAIRQTRLYEQARREREKSDALLLNVLPASVADDLRETGETTPREFENVTLYFSDVVGFTDIASRHEPAFVIGELNEIFTAFDNVMAAHQCERIKTSGDAYLAVCGVPEENENHAHNILQSALEIIEYLQDRNTDSLVQWQVRIGIHSGTVVGGVVGIKKYIYDVFGDAVNTAHRMESHSEPMRINVSEVTYQLVKDAFPFVARGAIPVKGKGELRMYFVEDADRIE